MPFPRICFSFKMGSLDDSSNRRLGLPGEKVLTVFAEFVDADNGKGT